MRLSLPVDERMLRRPGPFHLHVTYGLSVTSHWIGEDFNRVNATLRCEAFDGRHTALNIADALQETIKAWDIPVNKCHLVLRDNAAYA